MTRVVEEERVVRPGVPDEPGHCLEYVLAEGLLARAKAPVIFENDHILLSVPEFLHQKLGYVAVWIGCEKGGEFQKHGPLPTVRGVYALDVVVASAKGR